MPCVVHVYTLGSGVGDPVFETIAISGPFRSAGDAGLALAAGGWVCPSPAAEPYAWMTPRGRGRWADVIEMRELPGPG